MAYYPPLPPGQTIAASSSPVVIASDQAPIPIINSKNVTISGSLAGLNDTISIPCGDSNAGGIHVGGNFAGTISFASSINGIDYVPLNCIPLSGGPKVTFTNNPGDWDFIAGGQSIFKATMTNYISGAATVYLLKTNGIKLVRTFNTDPANLFATVNLRDGNSNNINSISGSLVVASDPNNPLSINGYDSNFQKLVVGSARDKFRDGFFTFDTTNNWDLIQTDPSMTISTSGNGNGSRYLYIQTSTAPNVETIIQSKKAFFLPAKIGFGLSLSQRIAGQEFYVELCSVDASGNVETDSTFPSPNSENALNVMGFKFDGTSATQVNHYIRGFGTPELSAALVTIGTTVATGTTPNFLPATQYELNLDMEQAIYNSWSIDSFAIPNNSYKRSQNLCDPAKQYKIRLRIKNLAPASTTDYRLHYMRMLDTTRVTVDFSRHMGRSTDLASALPVIVAGWNGTQAVTIGSNSSCNIAQVGGTNTVNGGLAGSLAVGGAAADSAASNTNPVQIGGKVKTAVDLTYVASDIQALTCTTAMQVLNKPYGMPEQDFGYTNTFAASSAPIAIAAAAGANIRNNITDMKFSNASLTPVTIIVFDGTVPKWQEYIPALTTAPPVALQTPIRGTANTAMNVAVSGYSTNGVPLVSGGYVFINFEGYKSF